MKNLWLVATVPGGIVMLGFFTAFILNIFIWKKKANYFIYGFCVILLVVLYLPFYRDLSEKTILETAIVTIKSDNSLGPGYNKITVQDGEAVISYKYSSFLYQQLGIEKGLRCKVYYFKHSKTIYSIEKVE